MIRLQKGERLGTERRVGGRDDAKAQDRACALALSHGHDGGPGCAQAIGHLGIGPHATIVELDDRARPGGDRGEVPELTDRRS